MPHDTADEDEIEDAQMEDSDSIPQDAVDQFQGNNEELSTRFETLESNVQKLHAEMIHPAAVRIVLKEYGLGVDTVDEILEDINAVDEGYQQRQGGADDE